MNRERQLNTDIKEKQYREASDNWLRHSGDRWPRSASVTRDVRTHSRPLQSLPRPEGTSLDVWWTIAYDTDDWRWLRRSASAIVSRFWNRYIVWLSSVGVKEIPLRAPWRVQTSWCHRSPSAPRPPLSASLSLKSDLLHCRSSLRWLLLVAEGEGRIPAKRIALGLHFSSNALPPPWGLVADGPRVCLPRLRQRPTHQPIIGGWRAPSHGGGPSALPLLRCSFFLSLPLGWHSTFVGDVLVVQSYSGKKRGKNCGAWERESWSSSARRKRCSRRSNTVPQPSGSRHCRHSLKANAPTVDACRAARHLPQRCRTAVVRVSPVSCLTNVS